MELIINYFQTIVSEIWILCVEMAPYLLLGMFVSGLISIFIDKNIVLKQIGSKDLPSILKSTLFGIPLPLCSCGVIPVAATLRESGASKGSTASFLVSTPQTGIDSIFLTYGMLGPVYALFRPLAALISGVFSGIIINGLDDEIQNLLNYGRSQFQNSFLSYEAGVYYQTKGAYDKSMDQYLLNLLNEPEQNGIIERRILLMSDKESAIPIIKDKLIEASKKIGRAHV